jgi:triphosphatase
MILATMTHPPATSSALAIQVLHQNATAFRERVPGALAGEDIEDVHQMRVATRRMRAALRLFADVLPSDSSSLHQELTWIADQLGPARDLDVQLHRLRETAAALGVSAELVPYGAWLEEQRRRAQAALTDALGSSRFQDLLERLNQLHEWTSVDTTVDPPLFEDGPRRLRRAHRRLRKRADPITEQSPPLELHAVRIRAKRLRYTAEFFEIAYGKPARRLARRAIALQDLLGEFQDGVVSGQRIREAVQTAAGTWPVETTLALGQVIQSDAQRARQIRGAFPDAYRALRKKGWKPLRRGLRRRQPPPQPGGPADAVAQRHNGVERRHVLDNRLDHVT